MTKKYYLNQTMDISVQNNLLQLLIVKQMHIFKSPLIMKKTEAVSVQSNEQRNEAKQLIGSIVVSFVHSELCASLLLDGITKSKQGTDVFNNKEWGAVQKLKAYKKKLKNLKHKSEEQMQVFEWINQLDDCRVKRNDAVHSMWTLVPVPVDGQLKFGKLVMPKKGKKKITSVAIKNLKTVESELISVQLKGALLLAKIIP